MSIFIKYLLFPGIMLGLGELIVSPNTHGPSSHAADEFLGELDNQIINTYVKKHTVVRTMYRKSQAPWENVTGNTGCGWDVSKAGREVKVRVNELTR